MAGSSDYKANLTGSTVEAELSKNIQSTIPIQIKPNSGLLRIGNFHNATNCM